jgi:hypothetical protein
MADFIGIDILGNEELARKLSRFPDIVQDDAIDDLSEYLIKVWRIYPPKKHVTRRRAYGRTFQSDKQRKYFFWALRNGIIDVPYRRTQTLRKNWQQIGSGRKSIIANETPYAKYVMGDETEQSRMMNIIGWISAVDIFDDRADRIDKVLYEATKKSLRKQGLI